MKEIYNTKTTEILQNNKICDTIASNHNFTLTNIPQSHSGLPKTFYSHNNKIYSSITTPLKIALYEKHSTFLKTKHPKRSEWFFSQHYNQNQITNSQIIPYQNITPKLIQSLIFTKERAFKFYLR